MSEEQPVQNTAEVEQASEDATVAEGTHEPSSPAPVVEDNSKAVRRFEAAKNAELRVRRAEQALKQREREVLSKQQEFESKLLEAEKVKKLFHEDPLAALEAIGVEDMKGFLEKVITPASAESKKLASLEQRLAQEEKARKDFEQAREADARKQQFANAMRVFLDETTEDKFPYTLGVFSREELPRMVEYTLKEHGPAFQEANGRMPSDEEIRNYIETLAKMRYTTAVGKLSKLMKAVEDKPSEAAGEEPASVKKNGSGHLGVNGPRTLTNDHAAQSASAKAKLSFDQEAVKRELVAQLKAEQAATRK